MNITKKMRFAVLIVVVLLIFVIIVIYRSISDEGIIPEKPTTKVPTPKIPKQFEGELSVEFTIDEDGFDFPRQLPIISTSLEEIPESRAKSIASNLNFSTEPLIFEDVNEGTKYIWRGEVDSLVITQGSGTIDYRYNSHEPPEVADEQLSDGEIIQKAETFLSEKFGLKQTEIAPASISYLVANPSFEGFSETQNKNSAEIFQVSFTFETTDYQLLTVSPNQPLISVRVLPNGSVYQAEAVLLKQSQESGNPYPIKSFGDVKSQINQAVLVSIRNDYINIRDLTKRDIRRLAVDSISLAYLFDSTTSRIKSLQPVFLLEGDVEVANSTADRALLYLPAIKNP